MSKNLNKSMKSKNDERFTPPILVEPIIDFISYGSTIWCPFDTQESEFVKRLSKHSKVHYTHIWNGEDFFTYKPDFEYDYIVSNPPFSRKLDVLERLFEIGKPFAMCMNIECLNYQVMGETFFNHQCEGEHLQLLIPDKKVSFDGNTSSFCTGYFCYKMLPRDLMFYHLSNNNTGADFVGSEMKTPEF